MGISFSGTALHKIFVEKNGYVAEEYENYLRINRAEGKKHRVKEWVFLFRANLAYFILNRKKDLQENRNSDVTIAVKPSERKKTFIELDQRESPYTLAYRIMKYDVISFDIFDTLILRPFLYPSDLFMIVGRRLGFSGYKYSFTKIRLEAEKKAREEMFRRYGHREVELKDIYEQISLVSDIDKDTAMITEINVEIEFCMANPYMLEVFEILKNAGKNIVLTSDMYLSTDVIKQMLEKCGYSGYNTLYLSCDKKISKTSKGYCLYNLLKDDYAEKTIVHIGDNVNSDITRAKELGLEAIEYKNIHKNAQQNGNYRMSEFLKSIYLGYTDCILNNGKEKKPFYYEFGFRYGGIYVYGYMTWLNRIAKNRGIEKILFIARDGYVYKSVYDRLFGSTNTEYVLWSRVSLMKYYSSFHNFEDFFMRSFAELTNSKDKLSIHDAFHYFGIEENLSEMLQFGLYGDALLEQNELENLKKYLLHKWEHIKKLFVEEKSIYENKLLELIGDATNIAIVDAACNGCGLLALKNIIKQRNPEKNVTICMASRSKSGQGTFVYDDETEVYLFSDNYNIYDFDGFYGGANKDGGINLAFEFLTQAPHSRFSGVTKDGKYVFDNPETENYEIANEIFNGIIDFAEGFSNSFSNEHELIESISGHEAIEPFVALATNKKYFMDNFDDVVVGQHIVEKDAFVKKTYKDVWK